MINERNSALDAKKIEMNPQEPTSQKPCYNDDPDSEANFSTREAKKRQRPEQKLCRSTVTSPRPSSPVPIINEFSDQSHRSKKRPKRDKKCADKKHLRKQCDPFLSVGNIGFGFESLFSENANAFALHHSANNMHFVNMSLKNQVVTLKNQVNQLSYDNQRMNRQNKMLLLERERLLTTLQNSSLLMRSTVSSIYPRVEDTSELVKRKNSKGSKNESELERATKCTIKEFDNLLTTLQTKEENRKLRDLDLYLDEERGSSKSRLKSVSQYDVIFKWLNNDNSDDQTSKDDESSKEPNSNDENSSKVSSSKNSSSEDVVQVLESGVVKESRSIKTLISSVPTFKQKSVVGSVKDTPLPTLRQNSHLASIQTAITTPLRTPKEKSIFTPLPTPKEKSIFTPLPTPKEKSIFTPLPTPKEKSIFTPLPTPKEKSIFTPLPTPKEKSIFSPLQTPKEKSIVPPYPTPKEKSIMGSKRNSVSSLQTPKQESHASPSKEKTPSRTTTPNVITPAPSVTIKTSPVKLIAVEEPTSPKSSEKSFKVTGTELQLVSPTDIALTSRTDEKNNVENENLESLIFGDSAVWMELDEKPQEEEEEKTEFLQSWLDDLKEKTRKYAESRKSSPIAEPDKKAKNTEDMEHTEFIHLCNEMIQRMDSLITKDTEKLSRRPSKSHLIMNFLLNESHSLNLKYSPKKETCSNDDLRSVSNVAKEPSSKDIPRDLLIISPASETAPNVDDNENDKNGWKAFHKCLKDLEEVNVRRTNDAIRQTMVVRALRKLLAKQCNKITKSHSHHRTPNRPISASIHDTANSKAIADKLPVDNYDKNLKSDSEKSNDHSPKIQSESNSVSSKENNRTPRQQDASFYRVFSNASKSIYFNNANFDRPRSASADGKCSLISVSADRSQYGFKYGNSVSSSGTGAPALTRKSRNSNKRRTKNTPNLLKISAALKRIQEEDKGIFDKEMSCENPKLISGCNIVDSTCRCEHSESCSDESPFNFKTRQECLINLNAMLAQKDEDELNDSAGDEDDEVENCNSQDCKRCPPDSRLDDDDQCRCDKEKCNSAPVVCRHGFVKQLTEKSTDKPGYCCDIYECVEESGKNCTNVACPEIPKCPLDSYQLPPYKSLDDCCLTPQGCQCLPVCDVPNCAPELALVVIEEGTGKPGKCCNVYECAKPVLKNGDELGNTEPRHCKTESGKIVENGYQWTNNDPCTTCTCENGRSVCQTYLCQACLNPVFRANECCPVCHDTHPQPVHCPPLPNCTEPCKHGNAIDTDGCMTCDCQLKDCRLSCPNGYVEDELGNKVCECSQLPASVCTPLKECDITCRRGFQKDENGCDMCKCQKCVPLDDCSKQCAYGYDKNDKGCTICKCKPWKTRNGEVQKLDASETSCKTEGGAVRDDGENWFDGCRQCTCVSGREMCSLIHCPTLSCANPTFNLSSSCCPFCPNEPLSSIEMNHMVCSSPSGSLMVEGETWMLDDCIQCLCHDGRALCRSKECPPTPCSHPRQPAKGDCCGICPVSNEVEAEPFGDDIKCSSAPSNSSAWREGSCTSCKCVDDKVRCYTELCDNNPKCKRSLTVKGKCCPICIDRVDKYKSDDICVFENHTFKANEEWAIDACTRCKCVSGRVECTQKVCSQSCGNGIRKPGRCCPSCPELNDGAEFSFMQEMSYIALLLIMTCVSIALVVYITRQWRYKKQQIRLRDFGCPPPQYQYKYIPSCPYDSSNSQQIITSEKASLAPV